MPDTCCVLTCRSNYGSQNGRFSVFSFPKDDEMKRKWICAIKRCNFTPSKRSKVCELHFKKEQILRSTKFYSASGDEYDVPLRIPRLKPDAVPSKFPGCPRYLTKQECCHQCLDSKRLCLEKPALLQVAEAGIESVKVYNQEQDQLSLNDVWEKFQTKNIGSWTMSRTENNIFFVCILEKPQPEVEYLGSIGEEMNFLLFHKTYEVKKIQNLKFPIKIQDCNYLKNILLQIEKESIEPQPVKDKIDLVTDILESVKSELPGKNASINFLIEQIKLMQCHKSNTDLWLVPNT